MVLPLVVVVCGVGGYFGPDLYSRLNEVILGEQQDAPESDDSTDAGDSASNAAGNSDVGAAGNSDAGAAGNSGGDDAGNSDGGATDDANEVLSGDASSQAM